MEEDCVNVSRAVVEVMEMGFQGVITSFPGLMSQFITLPDLVVQGSGGWDRLWQLVRMVLS